MVYHLAVNGQQQGITNTKVKKSKAKPKNNYLRTMHGSFFKELKMKANKGHQFKLSTGRSLKNTAICR